MPKRGWTWVFDPHTGGTKIPEKVKQQTIERLERHAAKKYAGKYTKLGIRFRGALCYIDAYTEPPEPDEELLQMRGETREQFMQRMSECPLHLCRLRYFGDDRWSLAFYTYSNERYEPSMYASGEWFGTPEEGFDVGALYLVDG